MFDHAGKENPALKGSETTFLSRSEQTEKLPNKASVQFPLIREKEKKKTHHEARGENHSAKLILNIKQQYR